MARNVFGVFAPSPFAPLEEHVKIVKECSDIFRACVEAYVNEDFETAEELALRISQLEHDADKIKNSIRGNLPRSIFMPVDRGDFLNYLAEQDHVADRIEEVVLTMSLHRTRIPEELKRDFLDLAKKSADVVDIVPLAFGSLNEILESTFKKKENRAEFYISLLGEKQQLTDHLDLKLRKRLFEVGNMLTHWEFFHLMRIVKLTGRIADHAENCGDRMRLMIARL